MRLPSNYKDPYFGAEQFLFKRCVAVVLIKEIPHFCVSVEISNTQGKCKYSFITSLQMNQGVIKGTQ